jgi:hypothetical protein
VFAASPEAKIDALDDLAAEALVIGLDPQTVEAVTKPPSDGLLGYLLTGDVVPVTYKRGGLDLGGAPYRIAQMSLQPDDSMRLTLNSRPPL